MNRFYYISKEEWYKANEKAIKDNTVKLLGCDYKGISLPKRATKGSAGYDFCSPYNFIVKPGETVKFPSMVKCMMNEGTVLMIFPRSSLGFKYKFTLDNLVGIIDKDFFGNIDNEGHIQFKFTNNGDKDLEIKIGDRIAQGIFVKYEITDDDYVEEERKGGIGSTNK